MLARLVHEFQLTFKFKNSQGYSVNHRPLFTLSWSVSQLNELGDSVRVTKTFTSCRPSWLEMDSKVGPTATTSLLSNVLIVRSYHRNTTNIFFLGSRTIYRNALTFLCLPFSLLSAIVLISHESTFLVSGSCGRRCKSFTDRLQRLAAKPIIVFQRCTMTLPNI